MLHSGHTFRPPRIYRGLPFWNSDRLGDDEMERMWKLTQHREYCDCGFEMSAKVDSNAPYGVYFLCNDCGLKRPFSGKTNLES